MKISRLYFRNVAGLENLDIQRMGRVTKITGDNGTGKTSALRGLLHVFKGGHEARLLRNGEEEGEIVIVIDDEETGRQWTLQKALHKNRTVSVRDQDGGKPPAPPMEFIQSMVDPFVLNPIRLIRAAPKDRADILVEQLDLRVTKEEFDEIGLTEVDKSVFDLPGLQAIDAVYDLTFKERTGINGRAKQARATAEKIRESLPENPIDPTEALQKVRKKLASLDAGLDAKKAEVSATAEKIKAELRRDCETDLAQADQAIEDLRAEIAKLEEKVRNVQSVRKDRKIQVENDLKQVDAEAKDQLHAYASDLSAEREKTAAILARGEEALKNFLGAAKQRENVDEYTREAAEWEAVAEALTQKLNGLQALKRRKLEDLPIKGIEFRDGDIYQDGIAFDDLNQAAQVGLALRFIRHRVYSKDVKLPLVCLDGLECLSAGTFSAFEEAAADSEDLQFFITRVSDSELAVETK